MPSETRAVENLDRALESLNSEVRRQQTALRAAQRALDATTRGTQAYERALAGVTRQQRNLNFAVERQRAFAREADRSNRSIRQLAGGLGNLNAAALVGGTAILAMGRAVGQLGAATIRAADQVTLMRNQIGLVSGDVDRTQQSLIGLAQNTRQALDVTTQLFVRTSQALSDLDPTISEQDVLRFTQAVQQSFIIAGSSAAEAANSTRQLTQAIAAGVLRGDEFRSLAENNLRLTRAIGDSLGGLNVGQLRELAYSGQLSALQVVRGILGETESLNAEFEGFERTAEQAGVQLDNSLTILGGWLADSTGIREAWINILDSVRGVADSITAPDLTAGAERQIEQLEAQIRDTQSDLLGDITDAERDRLLAAIDEARQQIAEVRRLGTVVDDTTVFDRAAAARARAQGLEQELAIIDRLSAAGLSGANERESVERRYHAALAESERLQREAAEAAARQSNEQRAENEALLQGLAATKEKTDENKLTTAELEKQRCELEQQARALAQLGGLATRLQTRLAADSAPDQLSADIIRINARYDTEIDRINAIFARTAMGDAERDARQAAYAVAEQRRRFDLAEAERRDDERTFRERERLAREAQQRELRELDIRSREIDAFLAPTAAPGTGEFVNQQAAQAFRQFQNTRMRLLAELGEGSEEARRLIQVEQANYLNYVDGLFMDAEMRFRDQYAQSIVGAIDSIGQAFLDFEDNTEGWLNLLTRQLPQIISLFAQASEAARGLGSLNQVSGSGGGGFLGFFRGLFGGSFHQGGVVPGPAGSERLILAQAGETIIPAGEGVGNVTINFPSLDLSRDIGTQIQRFIPAITGAVQQGMQRERA